MKMAPAPVGRSRGHSGHRYIDGLGPPCRKYWALLSEPYGSVVRSHSGCEGSRSMQLQRDDLGIKVVCRDADAGDRNWESEPPGTGTAGIEPEHAVAHLDR